MLNLCRTSYVLSILLIILLGSRQSSLASEPVRIFGTEENRSNNLKAFKKWTQVIARYEQEARFISEACSEKTPLACNYQSLKEFSDKIRNDRLIDKADQVNNLINQGKYINDQLNWGSKDVWNSPGQFMERFGDCEDFAIAKYVALLMAGVPDDSMRIVAVNDLNLKVGHAILVIFIDGKNYILDNQVKSLIEDKRIRHYEPIYSINRKYWWRHLK